MKQLVCLSYRPWRGVPTRTQQLLTRLKDVRILFFEPPARGGARRPPRQARPNILVYTLPQVMEVDPSHRFFFQGGQRRLAKYIRSILEEHRFREPLLWLTDPEQVHLLEYLPRSGVVYDCDREWDNVPLRWESDLALAADVIFAASPGLVHRLSPCNDNIALIPNGVNHVMFTRSDLEPPLPLRRLRHPIFCRVGSLSSRVDFTPLFHAASARPEWTFLLIGRCSAKAERTLSAFPNIRLMGPVPSVEVPDCLAACDVCFDLLRLDRMGSDILSPQLYEYFSTGKPVVTMLAPNQVEVYPDVVYAAYSAPGFLRCCGQAVQEDPNWVSRRRKEYSAAASWTLRAQEIDRILETAALF